MAKIHEIAVDKLHPTQLTVGLIEVEDKRTALASLGKHERRDFLEAHPIPGVWGPNGRLYITDHHHLARAAWELKLETGFFDVEADYAAQDLSEFWKRMLASQWAHPIDEHGIVRSVAAIPQHLDELRDDVYRSLAGYVRNAGGYDKTPTAFAEFQWADFFRKRIAIGPTRHDFDAAVPNAVALAKGPQAKGLPGYRGR